jgi:hypothetical protein
MKRLTLLLGLVSFIARIICLIHPSITCRKHDEIAKIGPIAATASLLIAGVVLIVLGAGSKS